jgi:hypothetical protein
MHDCHNTGAPGLASLRRGHPTQNAAQARPGSNLHSLGAAIQEFSKPRVFDLLQGETLRKSMSMVLISYLGTSCMGIPCVLFWCRLLATDQTHRLSQMIRTYKQAPVQSSFTQWECCGFWFSLSAIPEVGRGSQFIVCVLSCGGMQLNSRRSLLTRTQPLCLVQAITQCILASLSIINRDINNHLHFPMSKRQCSVNLLSLDA